MGPQLKLNLGLGVFTDEMSDKRIINVSLRH